MCHPERSEGSPLFLSVLKRTLVVAIVIVFAACSTGPKKPTYKKLPPSKPKPPAEVKKQPLPEEQKVPKDAARTNAKPSTADELTPKRQASQRLVDKGKVLLDSGDDEKAVGVFRDAINVDSSNGVAYYYLAVADSKLGRNEVALGLLDKAEAQLGADPDWMERITELRGELGESKEPIVKSPLDKAF